ncbi:hypothetical protein ACI5KX_00660 [Erythrobacter sp. GH1-10]|uniref:hypothetical protein n=1 Tax=Erythrobacter sp. GH1-10 TaxID=3349334 RepID=UPI003877AB47
MGRKQTESVGKLEQVGQGRVLWSQFGEQRETPRVSLLIRAAKLITSGEEFLCVVRNISAMGVKIRTLLPIPDEDNLVLETETGERHDVDLV